MQLVDYVEKEKYKIQPWYFSHYTITLSSLNCKSNQFPFEALNNMIVTLVGLIITLHFSGTISLFNLGMAHR